MSNKCKYKISELVAVDNTGLLVTKNRRCKNNANIKYQN